VQNGVCAKSFVVEFLIGRMLVNKEQIVTEASYDEAQIELQTRLNCKVNQCLLTVAHCLSNQDDCKVHQCAETATTHLNETLISA